MEIEKADFLTAGKMHEAVSDILLTRERGLEEMKVNEPGRWKLKRQTFWQQVKCMKPYLTFF